MILLVNNRLYKVIFEVGLNIMKVFEYQIMRKYDPVDIGIVGIGTLLSY